MPGKEFNISDRRPRVLITPLEWGLGHATRCIPIINELIANDCVVLIAATGFNKSLLQHEYPNQTFLSPPEYKVTYSRNKWFSPFKMLLQFPRIAATIYKEHQWLKKVVKEYKVDAVISDNRFGFYNRNIKSIYITHQLHIKTGNSITGKIANIIHQRFINKYNECWVPDFEGTPNLAGTLSHPAIAGNTKYIGCLSRLKRSIEHKQYDLLIIISGPEPQRTIFEKILLSQLKDYNGHTLFVRGKPKDSAIIEAPNKAVTIVSHLPVTELSKAIQQSTIVVSRSGYTTVMDLIKLSQKAILVPTPAQTEQEYLANYLMSNNIFYCDPQKQFVLKEALLKAESFPFNFPAVNMELYKETIRQLVLSLKH